MSIITKVLLLFSDTETATSMSVTTTAPNETLTINVFGVSAETTILWGDGQSDAYTGTALRTHQYASSGTYTVAIQQPENVTTFDIRDTKVTLNSADIAGMINIVAFTAIGLSSGTFNSADVSTWNPTTFVHRGMTSGYLGTFNSADVSTWNPTSFQFYSMPSGYLGTFNSADVSTWNPTIFLHRNMPSGYTFIVADPDFSGWLATNNFQMQGNGLTQAQVDSILYSLYSMTTSRTAVNGTINISGSNAAPTGVFQAASACPVTTGTDGKEVAHELLNDTCVVGFNPWATVTFTA